EAPRNDAVASPVRRSRRRFAVASPRLLHRILEHLAGSDRGALRRSPCGQPRAQRAGSEIGVRFGLADLLHLALDAHLALELRPLEDEAGERPGIDLVRLAAGVIGVERETAALEPFQEDD